LHGLEFRLQAELILITPPEGGTPNKNTVSLPAFTFGYFLLTFAPMPKCPTCGKPVEWQDNSWRPFCSERCKLIDFSRWANEEYRVPGQKNDQVEIAEQPADEATNGDDDLDHAS
jgi:endogenous inhibitor of DNA gyrase (YacG/DUF329 family)